MENKVFYENKVSEILENILGLLSLEGSFEVEESADYIAASIEIIDAGKLIGRHGETLSALQLIVNQILAKSLKEGEEFKKVVIDVSNWRKSREEDLAHKARAWAQKVIETSEQMELEPMPAWERRVIHLTISGTEGVESESLGEGINRHIIIKPAPGEKVNEKSSKKVTSKGS
ncbi:KH domain-containing protein [Candidatus Daviesbacteria bacterium]|nr:KH domain-containing protein [Candidatus Daviesbacteria bacterium]